MNRVAARPCGSASARVCALAALVAWITIAPAHGQGLPTEPLSVAGGRVVVGAEMTVTAANADPGYFNYTDYEFSALRNIRVGVSAEVRATRRFQLLAEVRMDHGDVWQPFALYGRIRPWPDRRFDVQIGRVPPTFGAYGRGTYGTQNMLIGTPLAYQYLTSLRTDALPATTADLVTMRGRGWLSSFPIGNTARDRGIPIVNGFRWDTGVQLHGINGVIEWTTSVTTGSLSNPRVDDDNDGRQMAGRVVVRPTPGLMVGTSVARGAFLNRSLQGSLSEGRSVEEGVQQALGVDAEYSVGRLLVRGEMIRSAWTLPIDVIASGDDALRATAVMTEARYRVWPGLHVAARAEQLGFGDVPTAAGSQSWDARVRRLEIGGGYSIIRNVMVKSSWQRNTRDGGRVRRDTLGAIQVVYWF
jgi:hypothetical protein